MLEQITLRNFQKHSKLVIDLDPLVTVLVGPTDKGKSSTLRAFRWLATNRPLGDVFIKKGTEHVRVAVKLDDQIIKREKVGGDNSYWLDGNKYQAFGQGVPDEIATLLNLSEVNFQSQHDDPWWLGLSPGEVSKQLNAIIDLGLIDTTLANLASVVKKAKATVSVSQDRLKQAKENRHSLAWVKEADKQYREIEELATRQNDTNTQAQRLQEVLYGLEQAQTVVDTAAQRIQQASELLSLGEKIEKITQKMSQLETVIGEMVMTRTRWTKAGVFLEQAKRELVEKTEGRCPICGGELNA